MNVLSAPAACLPALSLILATWITSNTAVGQDEGCSGSSGSSGSQGSCEVCVEIVGHPARSIEEIEIGWTGGPAFLDTQAASPTLIPIEIRVNDDDTIIVICGGTCTQIVVPGDWQINWEVSDYDQSLPYPYRGGSLVDANADRHDALDGPATVMYLPPEDLEVNDLRISTITAEIVDSCGGIDPIWTVVFEAWTARLGETTWGFYVFEQQRDEPAPEVPNCESEPSGDCELVGGSQQGALPPFEISRSPGVTGTFTVPEIYLGEFRPLTLIARDFDRYTAECGTPGEPGAGVLLDYCDEVTYLWEVDNLPSYQGDGDLTIFEQSSSNTVVFRATEIGNVRVRVDAISANDQTQSFYFTFLVIPHDLAAVDFAPDNQHDILQDGGTSAANDSYKSLNDGTEWSDSNNDGDNDDPGDFAYPMAYTRDTEIFTQQLLKQVNAVKSMPGSAIRGISSDNSIEFVAMADGVTHYETSSQILYYTAFVERGRVPDNAGKHELVLDWETWHNLYVDPLDIVETRHRLYTTFADPLELVPANASETQLITTVYNYWESAYDIACIGANNTTSASDVLQQMLQHYNGLDLTRKTMDGFNVSDGAPLIYWGPPGTPNLCTGVGPLLDPTGNGIGTCASFGQLFRLSLGLHGVGARLMQYTIRTPMRSATPPPAGVNLPFGTLTELQSEFLVREWPISAGDSLFRAGYIHTVGPPTVGFLDPPILTNTDPDRMRPLYSLGVRMSDANGIAAQGPIQNPKSNFRTHALVRYGGPGGVLYDPSYGSLTAYADEFIYTTTNIHGIVMPDASSTQNADGSIAIVPYQGANAPAPVLTESNQ